MKNRAIIVFLLGTFSFLMGQNEPSTLRKQAFFNILKTILQDPTKTSVLDTLPLDLQREFEPLLKNIVNASNPDHALLQFLNVEKINTPIFKEVEDILKSKASPMAITVYDILAAKNSTLDQALIDELAQQSLTSDLYLNGSKPYSNSPMSGIGYSAILTLLLDAGANPNLKVGNLKASLLEYVIHLVTTHKLYPVGGSIALSQLIAHGAQVNAQNTLGNTPLMYAALEVPAYGLERNSFFKVLLDAGADVNIKNNAQENVLLFLIRYATDPHWSQEYAKLLLEHNINLMESSENNEETLIQEARLKGKNAIATLIEDYVGLSEDESDSDDDQELDYESEND